MQGHHQVCCTGRRGPTTVLRTTDTSFDCALLKTHLLSLFQIWGPGPLWPKNLPFIQCLQFLSVFCLKCYKCANSQESLLSLQPGYQGLCTSASTTSAIDCPDGTLACTNQTNAYVHKTASGKSIRLEWSQMGCASQDQAGFFKIGTCRSDDKSQGIECMCDTDYCNGPNKGIVLWFFFDIREKSQGIFEKLKQKLKNQTPIFFQNLQFAMIF